MQPPRRQDRKETQRRRREGEGPRQDGLPGPPMRMRMYGARRAIETLTHEMRRNLQSPPDTVCGGSGNERVTSHGLAPVATTRRPLRGLYRSFCMPANACHTDDDRRANGGLGSPPYNRPHHVHIMFASCPAIHCLLCVSLRSWRLGGCLCMRMRVALQNVTHRGLTLRSPRDYLCTKSEIT
jgi:hypothetical protein